MIKKIKNILKNLTIKQVCKKSAEYFLVFIAIKLFVFAIDSTILRYNRLENGVFRYRDFYSEKQLKNFFDRFYTVGSNVAPLLGDLERYNKNRCRYGDHRSNNYNQKGVFLTKNMISCYGYTRWFRLGKLYIHFSYQENRRINTHDDYSEFAQGKGNFILTDDLSFYIRSAISHP